MHDCIDAWIKLEATFNQKLLRGVQGGGFLEKSPPGRRRQKIYKTGDRARWLKDGTVEFLGRMDVQVKIRGYRIEPGEIENQLLNHRDVKEALVMAREYENGENYLCAYIVGNSPVSPGVSGAELRDHLSAELPDQMIPAHFIFLLIRQQEN